MANYLSYLTPEVLRIDKEHDLRSLTATCRGNKIIKIFLPTVTFSSTKVCVRTKRKNYRHLSVTCHVSMWSVTCHVSVWSVNLMCKMVGLWSIIMMILITFSVLVRTLLFDSELSKFSWWPVMTSKLPSVIRIVSLVSCCLISREEWGQCISDKPTDKLQ